MTILIKTILVLLFVFIVFALGSALYYLISDKGDSERIVKALTWRIGLSLLLFVILIISFAMGWITPNNI
jgi:TRAP-type C4-dicarboxylate transport system permease large subunit